MNHGHDPACRPSPWLELIAAVRNSWPPQRWGDVGVVVGCSGGADSVALLRALCDLHAENAGSSGFIIAAHFDHGVRGQEAFDDADFVRDLSGKMGVRYATDRAGNLPADESTMRAARTAFLRQIAQNSGARYVAVAHSVDDNVETVLHNLMRGTGPKGFAGIPLTRPLGEDPIGQDLILIRPLLNVRRDLIRTALKSIGQDWREDSSNENTEYRRNWIRRELLPLMQTQYPSVVEAIQRAAALQSEWKSIIQSAADQWLNQHATFAATVTIKHDRSTPAAIVITSLQQIWKRMQWPLGEMSHNHWKRLADTIANATDDRYSLPGGVDVCSREQDVELRAASGRKLVLQKLLIPMGSQKLAGGKRAQRVPPPEHSILNGLVRYLVEFPKGRWVRWSCEQHMRKTREPIKDG